MKTCTKCNVSKNENSFTKNKNSKDGLQLWCKDCCHEYNVNKKKKECEKENCEYKPKIKVETKEGYKICCKCKTELPYKAFSKSSSNKDGYHNICKSCDSKRHKVITKERVEQEGREYKEKVKLIASDSDHRICHICKKELSLENFAKVNKKCVYDSYCKDCRKKIHSDCSRERAKANGIEYSPKKIFPIAKDGYKFCCKCEQEKSLDNFYKDKNTSDGYTTSCKKCDRDKRLHSKYGLSPEDVQNMLSAQDNKCKICGKEFIHEHDVSKTHCIDHCHKTGKVRGLLCSKCNSILGYCDDNTEILEAAIKYLVEHK